MSTFSLNFYPPVWILLNFVWILLNWFCISEKTDSNFVSRHQELHLLARTSSLSIGRCLGIKDALPANDQHNKQHKSGHKYKSRAATWKSATFIWSKNIWFDLRSVSYRCVILIYLNNSCLMMSKNTWIDLKM